MQLRLSSDKRRINLFLRLVCLVDILTLFNFVIVKIKCQINYYVLKEIALINAYLEYFCLYFPCGANELLLYCTALFRNIEWHVLANRCYLILARGSFLRRDVDNVL